MLGLLFGLYVLAFRQKLRENKERYENTIGPKLQKCR